ncbi:pyridoxamine 5'-phosphate oxidase family protein [Glaciecola sp. KUL10]|uniref:pyridoxamine 5'-phosphate oxidase family protein n=1 Tax=Glaciecola sp. (strain KUL10) TaxID=2161813 RepID=UPI000D78900C|nr:pyridoxamine 5'-phosphate oxidase family protein [Glaciecola sp. KUL10]GBL03027.1 pyridoxamine 5'-phosphate oxidase-like FMN-binding protein [Glaciecola sp. KUL10]
MPQWKQNIQRSLHLGRSKHETKYFQVASIDANDLPAVRTMVFRGFDDQHNIYAVTDIRSTKITEFKNRHEAQICWYFAKTREQYRISCKVEILTEGILYRSFWDCLSDTAKLSFDSPKPKSPIDSDGQIQTDSAISKISKNYALIQFRPNECDYLNLKCKPQHRELEVMNPDSFKWETHQVNA